MKNLKLAAALALAFLPLVAFAQTWAWTSTYPPTSNQFATFTSGRYIVSMDVWGGVGTQTINANSGSNWQVISNVSSNSVASYPHVEFNNINQPVNSLSAISSSFNATNASGANYDFAYDIWVGTSSSPFQYEVMIWNTWNGTQPIAQSYNAAGQAVPTFSNVTISGKTYNVYTGVGGSGPHCISFLPNTQSASGTIDITAILQWINSVGYFNDPVNPTLRGIQLGWEFTNTFGSKTFTMNNYSVTIGTSSTVATTGVTVSPTSASVAVGGTTTLTAAVAPSNASNKTVTWSSSNTSAATVSSSGVVTGVAAGSAMITATTASGGFKAASAITVTGGSSGGGGGSGGGGNTVTVPFTKDGVGDVTYVTSGTINNLNSWNLQLLTVNGVNCTNIYKTGAQLPARVNGAYTIHYVSTVAWGHLEIR